MERKVMFLIVAVVIVIGLVTVVGLAVGFSLDKNKQDEGSITEAHQSATGRFRYAAVSADNDICSTIGTEILARFGGSAVDAAIATFICLGAINSQHLGLGGGYIMLIYERPRNSTERELVVLSSRATAPLWVTPSYFESDPQGKKTGPKSIAVPCEVKGYWEAWQRFGRVSWSSLFSRTIALCQNGWPVSESMALSIQSSLELINQDESLREAYLKEDGSPYSAGDTMKNPKLERTLQLVAEQGPEVFYTGSLAQDIVKDISDAGGIITMADMASASSSWQSPVEAQLQNSQYHMYVAPPSSSGIIVQFILKFIDNYIGQNTTNLENYVGLMNKLIQAWQLGFTRRKVAIGDTAFETEEMKMWKKSLLNDDYINELLEKMPDNADFDTSFDSEEPDRIVQGGTSHLNVLTAEGSAVAATSTVGALFGSKIRGNRTGLIFNNGLTLFTLPSSTNTTTNYMEPGKLGRSSTSPTIVLNNEGKVVLLIGASGGTRIITSISYVMIHTLLLNQNLTYAISKPRLHDHLDGKLYYDEDIPGSILDGLREKGYSRLTPTGEKYPYLGVCQAIDNRACLVCGEECRQSCIEAVSDWRKMGRPDGY